MAARFRIQRVLGLTCRRQRREVRLPWVHVRWSVSLAPFALGIQRRSSLSGPSEVQPDSDVERIMRQCADGSKTPMPVS